MTDTVARPGRRIAGAFALIAGLTVASRLAGFGRTMVFAWAVGDTDLGDVYLAANQIPNIVFEIVAGGALASLVVPLLAGAIAAGDRATAGRTASALLTWALTLLVPLATVIVAGADLIIGALLPGTAAPAELAVGAQLLRIFAPQLPLYAVGIVLAGTLQAHRRFAWPVLVPLLSSLTVAAAYLGFTAVDRRGADVATVTRTGELVLAVGTTLGVAVLSLCLVPPVRRLGLRWRPGWRFDGDARRRVGGLATAGGVTVAAQQLALLVLLKLGLAGQAGSWVLYQLAQTIFLVPWAVLAVPLATATYPNLAEAAATGRHDRYRATLARATRAVLLLAGLGAAALAALAGPGAALLDLLMPTAHGSAGPLAAGIVGFAPGLLGYGLYALLSRALYARGDTAVAAVATVTGWAVAALAATGLATALAADQRVVALTTASSVGMTILGAVLLALVARRAGRAALAGVARAARVTLVAGALAGGGGYAVSRPVLESAGATPDTGPVLLSGMLSGVVVLAVFAVVAYTLDRRDVRPLAATAWRRLRGAAGRADRRPEQNQRPEQKRMIL